MKVTKLIGDEEVDSTVSDTSGTPSDVSVVSMDEIMEIIKGPDFPTGGIMYDSTNIKEVYKKGK